MKKFLLLFCITVCTATCCLHAQETIESLNRHIAQIEAEIKRNETLLGKIKGEKAITQNELKLIASRIKSRLSIIESLESQIKICERDIEAKNREITDLNSRIETLKKEYGEMIYAAYKNYLLNNSMAFIFASKDFHEATVRINYMKRYNKMREAKAAELDSLSNMMQSEIKILNAQREQLAKSKRSRDEELTTLREDERVYQSNSSRLAADERKISDKIRQSERQKLEAQRQLQRLVAEEARRSSGTKRSDAEQRAVAALSNNFEQNEGKFPYPVRGGVIIDHFGKHPHPTQRGLTVDNKGVNIAAERGAEVRAIFEGTVSRVVFIKGLNNCVMINHGNYYTVYSNLSEVYVAPNDKIDRNTLIGRLPQTDNNDDWYIHFELWKGTTYLNPEKWFSR